MRQFYILYWNYSSVRWRLSCMFSEFPSWKFTKLLMIPVPILKFKIMKSDFNRVLIRMSNTTLRANSSMVDRELSKDTIQIPIIAMTTARIISQSGSISNFMFAISSSTESTAKKMFSLLPYMIFLWLRLDNACRLRCFNFFGVSKYQKCAV